MSVAKLNHFWKHFVYPDCNNHLIDATRYALERVFRRMGVRA